MFCGKCGKEVPEGYEFCMGCGTKLEPLTEQVVQIKKKNKIKKTIISLLLIIVVVAIVIGVISLISVNKKKNGLYNNIAWGTSYDEIKGMVEKHSEEKVTTNEEETIVYDYVENYQDFEGVNAIVVYKCNDDKKLITVLLLISNNEDSKYTDEMLLEGLIENFTELYGEYEDKSFEKIWTTKKSTVSLVYVMDGMFTVDYEPLTDN